MQLTHGLSSPAIFLRTTIFQKRLPKPPKAIDRYTSKYVVEEINAYIAVRDNLLAEAEEQMTEAKVRSACVANEHVESCLKPARPPYEGQHLPEVEAIHERKRCEAAKARLAELRAQIEEYDTNGAGSLSRCA